MAKYWLLNTVSVGTTKYLSGREIDDTRQPKADIEKAGGILWDYADTKVTAAAKRAAVMRSQSASDESVDQVMMASASAALAVVNNNRIARGVCIANMSLTAFVGVTGGTPQDGVTYAEGDLVLLAGQTTGAQCGLYTVGKVASGTAPLTRVADMAAGQKYVPGEVVEVAEGTLFAGSSWKAMATGSKVVGTDDPLFYPRVCRARITLAAGTKTLGAAEGLFLFSTTTSMVLMSYVTLAGTIGTAGLGAPAASRTAGKSGTGALVVNSYNEDKSVGTSDTSTVDVLVCNW